MNLPISSQRILFYSVMACGNSFMIPINTLVIQKALINNNHHHCTPNAGYNQNKSSLQSDFDVHIAMHKQITEIA